MEFLTITIENKCFDLPKNMPIPQKGDNVFVEDMTGIVDYANYHIVRGKLHSISIFTIKDNEN